MGTIERGLVLFIDDRVQAYRVAEEVERKRSFTDALCVPGWLGHHMEVAFITLDGRFLQYVATVSIGNQVATGKRKLHFTDVRSLDSLPIEEALGGTATEWRGLSRSPTGRAQRIPEGTWLELLSRVKDLRPALADDLGERDYASALTHSIFDEPEYKVVAEERDAVGLALSLGGMGRSSIVTRTSAELVEVPAPFLRTLLQSNHYEDSMLHHDLRVFGDWELLGVDSRDVAVFGQGRDRMVVMNVNRRAIEHTLGVV